VRPLHVGGIYPNVRFSENKISMYPQIYWLITITGWWCNNHLEKYEFINGKDDNPYMKWKIKNV
jgi:hypothetical protein